MHVVSKYRRAPGYSIKNLTEARKFSAPSIFPAIKFRLLVFGASALLRDHQSPTSFSRVGLRLLQLLS